MVDKMFIKIHNRKYKVEYKTLESETLLGETNNKSAIIRLSNKIDNQLLYSTIVHELVHAYLFEYGIYDDNYTNENVCNFFGAYGKKIIETAEIVYNAFKGNKKNKGEKCEDNS